MAVTAKKAARTTAAASPKTGAPKRGAALVPAGETRVFHVALHGRRSIWRDVELRSEATLSALAGAALRAFDFSLDHAFGFYPTAGRDMYRTMPRYELFFDMGEPAEDGVEGVERTEIETAFPEVGKRMVLLFDYGDEWLFDVELTAKGHTEPRARYPRLLRQGGKAPKQYPGFSDDA